MQRTGNAQILHNPTLGKMLRDNPVEIFRRAISIPNPIRINDGDWAFRANAQAIRLCALNATMFAQSRLLQAFLEMLPTRCCYIRDAATLFTIPHAQKDMSTGFRQPEFFDGQGGLFACVLSLHEAALTRLLDGCIFINAG